MVFDFLDNKFTSLYRTLAKFLVVAGILLCLLLISPQLADTILDFRRLI